MKNALRAIFPSLVSASKNNDGSSEFREADTKKSTNPDSQIERSEENLAAQNLKTVGREKILGANVLRS